MCITVSKRPTEKTISKWISSRARRMGFKRHDIEDVQQQILLVLMDFEFNPVSGRPKPATDGRVKTSHLRQRRNCHAPFSSPVAKGANTWQTYSKWLQSLTSLH